MIDKYVNSLMEEIEEKGVTITSGEGENAQVSRLFHYSRDNFSNYEPSLVNMIQNNNPKFSSARFKQTAYVCLRKIMFAFVKEEPNIYRPFVTDGLYEYLNVLLNESKKDGHTRIIERVLANPMFLTNYSVNELDERLGFGITVGRRDYYKRNDVYREPDYAKKENIVSSFYLEFIKKKGVQHENEIDITNCPNCGAPLNIHDNGECEYCHALVTNGQYSWTLDKICYWDKREGVNNGC